MTMRSAGYWTTTTIIAIAFLSGGAAYLAGAGFALQGMLALGYPAYFVTILGAWKALGGIAILAPRSPRLKEWAYAGIAFDLSGAALSHIAVGDPAAKVVAPLVMLGIAAASWALRPPGRRLQGLADRPAEAGSDAAGAPDAMARAAA
jgi:DoxX-like family